MSNKDQGGEVPTGKLSAGRTVDDEDLGSRRPEDLVAACRASGADPNFVGKALDHLSSRATRFLTTRIDRNLPDGGRGAVEAVVDGMLIAILDPDAADGVGFAAAFHAKLRQRLVDQVRKLRLEANRTEEPQPADGSDGEAEADSADNVSLSPEESLILGDMLAALPENHRKAFLLDRAGFPMSSGNEESISSMLGVTPKTAKDWIDKAKAAIRQHLGPDR